MPRDEHNDLTMVERVDPLVGSVLDRKYQIEKRLAVGGFGAVYRARHIASNHEFAIKVVHGRFASDPAVVARFKREGATLTTLRCPHTITAYELGETSDGTLYMVMELLHGQNLFDRYAQHGRFEWRRMVKIGRAICASLSEAHALGVVHRDLKPTNIHLERLAGDDDFVKVLDFGIAKILQSSQFDNTDLTSAGQMIGTLDYMSPEQMVGGAVTGATDVYTLGIVLYEMIAGRRPFAEATSASSALAAVLKPPPPLSAFAIVPAELDRIVMRCLERDLVRRYTTIDELAVDLDRVLGPSETADATRPIELPGDDDATQISSSPKLSAVPISLVAAPPPPPPAAPPRVALQALHAHARAPTPQPDQTLRGMGAVRSAPATVPVVDATMIDPRFHGGDAEPPPTERETFFRRVIWIVVLSVAAAVGVFAATHL